MTARMIRPVFAVLAIWVFVTTASAATGPVLVFDARTGEVLLARRAGEPWYPASLTKLMTAYITFKTLRSGRITLKTRFTVSKHAASRPPSKIGIKAGKTVSVDFALKAILIHSANDMAAVLAEGIAGSIDGFAKIMNAEARRLGMSGSHFVNPHGLFNPAQVVTARDIGLLAATIINEFPQYRNYFTAQYMQVGKRRLKNRDRLMTSVNWVDGMKTGFVCASGYNLVSSATLNNRRLISVVLGGRSGAGRDALARVLLEWSAGRSKSSLRVANIRNLNGRPRNLKNVVCKKGARVTWGQLNELSGWGVSLGRYKTAYKADGVLQGRILTTASVLPAGKQGIFRALAGREYLALLSGMNEQGALRYCSFLRRNKAHCEVMTPQAFSEYRRQRARASNNRRKKKKRYRKVVKDRR